MLSVCSLLKEHEHRRSCQAPDHKCSLHCSGQGALASSTHDRCSIVLVQFTVRMQATDILTAAAPISVKKQDLADLELGVSYSSQTCQRGLVVPA